MARQSGEYGSSSQIVQWLKRMRSHSQFREFPHLKELGADTCDAELFRCQLG
jgi:hypothetical protein